MRQPGAQRSHRGPGLGLARANSGPGAGPGKKGGTKAPEGARPRLQRDAEHGSGYSWLSVPESKKWGPDVAASLVKGSPAPDVLVRLDSWAWTCAFRVQKGIFPPPTSLLHPHFRHQPQSPTECPRLSKGKFSTECLGTDGGRGLCLAGERQGTKPTLTYLVIPSYSASPKGLRLH